MRATYFRYKFYLLGAVLTLLMGMMPKMADGQINVQAFDDKFQRKIFHFGITLGFNRSTFKVNHSESFFYHDSIMSVESKNGPGFNLGIVSNLRLGKHFDLRFVPTLVFAEKNLEYQIFDGSFANKKIESIYVDFPFLLKFKSKPYKEMRVFVIAGAKYSMDLASNSKARNAEDLIKIRRHDASIEYGFGFEFYFPFFIFSPEFRFSQGIYNIHSLDNKLQFSDVLKTLFSRAFTISIHFEG